MRVIEVSMEQCRNERAGQTGEPRYPGRSGRWGGKLHFSLLSLAAAEWPGAERKGGRLKVEGGAGVVCEKAAASGNVRHVYYMFARKAPEIPDHLRLYISKTVAYRALECTEVKQPLASRTQLHIDQKNCAAVQRHVRTQFANQRMSTYYPTSAIPLYNEYDVEDIVEASVAKLRREEAEMIAKGTAAMQSYSAAAMQSCPAAAMQSCHAAAIKSCPAAAMQSCPAAAMQSCPAAAIKSCPAAAIKSCPAAAMQSCPAAAMQSCPAAAMQSCHAAAMQSCHAAAMQSCHAAAMQSCHAAAMQSCHAAAMQSCPAAAMQSCPAAAMKSCPAAAMQSYPATAMQSSAVVMEAAVAEHLPHPPSPQREPASIPGRVTGFSHVGFVPDDVVGWRVFSGISRFHRPFIPALLHTQLNLALRSIECAPDNNDFPALGHSASGLSWQPYLLPFPSHLYKFLPDKFFAALLEIMVTIKADNWLLPD
ncbi:hypothetical protein PR048_015208 [Dryococelus australis]|uniref:Uncharacterized protein n=1 Tax=Dryococelus australis TaxID=614101 RepID=A0ABQ9HGA9_9NEOP|nr:hypothetical protein PR048_015208 [Dryococelus australis]